MIQARLLRSLSSKCRSASATIQGRAASLLASNRVVDETCTGLLPKQNDVPGLKPYQLVTYTSVAPEPGPKTNIASIDVDPNRRSCYITWHDGFYSEFHSVWLRHNCHCEECRHPTGQRLLEPASVSSNVLIDRAVVAGVNIEFRWRDMNGVHDGYIPISFLRSHNYNTEDMMEKRVQVKPKPAAEISLFLYEDFEKSGVSQVSKWIQSINEDGISIIKDVPRTEDMVLKIRALLVSQEGLEEVAPLAPTIYGDTFDVQNTGNPINVAYSSLPIDLHQDLVYFESPPGLQLLHCLEFDDTVEGGDSTFLDALDIADQFRVSYPDHFKTLTEVPATFQKVHYERDHPVHIVNQKPHIKLNHLGEVCAVYWAPPFEGPLAVDRGDVERYYLAYEAFAKMLKNANLLRHRLRPGELVVFNNLRMFHGRDGFKNNGGERRLKGSYLNIDMFKSQAQVLRNLVGDGRPAKRVGNQCWF